MTATMLSTCIEGIDTGAGATIPPIIPAGGMVVFGITIPICSVLGDVAAITTIVATGRVVIRRVAVSITI